jgi:hypothetical protein
MKFGAEFGGFLRMWENDLLDCFELPSYCSSFLFCTGIEALREKLMLDLRVATDKTVFALLRLSYKTSNFLFNSLHRSENQRI